MNYLIIEADTNDADYVHSVNKISDAQLEKLKPIIKIIKKCKSKHNWPASDFVDGNVNELYKDLLTEDQIDLFNNLCPYFEGGIHTISCIRLFDVTKVRDLL